MASPIRRLVSGLKADGTSGLIQDGASPHVVVLDKENRVYRTDVWASAAMPYDNADPADPTSSWPDDRFGPLSNGTSFFVMQIPPDKAGLPPALHQTDRLDYIVILQREIYVVFADDERLVRQDDIVVQRGTPYAWSNRSSQPCTFAASLRRARATSRCCPPNPSQGVPASINAMGHASAAPRPCAALPTLDCKETSRARPFNVG